jgi:hypothetical protein
MFLAWILTPLLFRESRGLSNEIFGAARNIPPQTPESGKDALVCTDLKIQYQAESELRKVDRVEMCGKRFSTVGGPKESATSAKMTILGTRWRRRCAFLFEPQPLQRFPISWPSYL